MVNLNAASAGIARRYGLPLGWWAGELHGSRALAQADQLYRSVFAYQGEHFSLNPMLLQGIAHNGGSMVGVRNEVDELVGFAYGFVGYEHGTIYHYSQAAVVSPVLQGKGIGKALKLAQRDIVLASGIHEMRWAFDPAYSRNGHFNFNTLGAIGDKFFVNFYDVEGSDRIVTKWALDDPRPTAVAEPPVFDRATWGEPQRINNDAFWLPLPARLVAGTGAQESDESMRARLKLREALSDLVTTQHFKIVSCRRIDDTTSAYQLQRGPYDD